MAVYVIVVAIIVMCTAHVNPVLVEVNQGILNGEIVETVTKDAQYYSFKGIPYAAPPVGKLRFKAPRPPKPWEGIREATEHGARCPYKDIFSDETIRGSEDCLFLNVYSPDLNPRTPLPVMFFIHGGGFKNGSGNDNYYGPDYLLTYGVVLVTINYRLGALGFLGMDTKDVPGNAGMKDQVAALQWVQENIEYFGGDPASVTIIGQSAGGTSVGYHILSPLSKGLFKRAIAMSGTPFCEFATSFRSRDKAFVVGRELGFHTDNTTALLEYLQNVPFEKLYDPRPYLLISEEKIDEIITKYFHFVPIVEKDFGTGSNYLTEDPLQIMRNGNINDVDIMVGYTNKEILAIIDSIDTYLHITEKYPEMLVPNKILLNSNAETILDVSNILRKYYFGNEKIDINVVDQYINYADEVSFIYPINRFTALLPEPNGGNTRYLYKFTTTSNINHYGNKGLKYNITGASHMDDLLYLFYANSLNMTISKCSREYALINQICTLFTNLVKYGNPTPNEDLGVYWPQYDSTVKSYLEIGNVLTSGTDPDAGVTTFWDSIYEFAGFSFY